MPSAGEEETVLVGSHLIRNLIFLLRIHSVSMDKNIMGLFLSSQ